MAYYTDKQRRYWAKWRESRTKKWNFVLIRGVLLFGVGMFTAVYLFEIRLDFSKFNLSHYLLGLAVWSIGGLIWGLWMFSFIEKKYQYFLENDDDE